jgi:hypothetical protein
MPEMITGMYERMEQVDDVIYVLCLGVVIK